MIKLYQAAGNEVPLSLQTLVESDVDGRLVSDVRQLFHPEEVPSIPSMSAGESPANSLSGLLGRQTPTPSPSACNNGPCGNVQVDCIPYGCYACYFPFGPPVGTCFG
jgi:hypothetical protein